MNIINMIDLQNKQCNHNPNLKDATLVQLKQRRMINPPEFDFFCPCCKKVFKMQKDEKGNYINI